MVILDMQKELKASPRLSVTRTDFSICQAYGAVRGDMLSNISVARNSKLKLDHDSFATNLRSVMKEYNGIHAANENPILVMQNGTLWLVSPVLLNSAGFYICLPIKCRVAAIERLVGKGAFDGEIEVCLDGLNRSTNGKITPADMEIYKNILRIADALSYLAHIDEREFDADALYSVYDIEAKILDIAAFVGCEIEVESSGRFSDGYLRCKDPALFCGFMLACIATAARYSVLSNSDAPSIFV